MEARDRRQRLRGIVFERDLASLVALLRDEPWPRDALQLLGDGVVAAMGEHVDGAEPVAHTCVTALEERDWDGDAELADALKGRLGIGPIPLLRPLAIDLEELSMVLEGDPASTGGRIDLETGEVWPQAAIDYARDVGDEDEDDDDEQRWLWVSTEGSRAGYRDMELFVAGLDDPAAVEKLSRALVGRGAFGRFKHALMDWPELQTRWHDLSEERKRGRARAWLASEGYQATLPQREGS